MTKLDGANLLRNIKTEKTKKIKLDPIGEGEYLNKISPYQTEMREKLRDKVNFNFGTTPRFVSQEFDKLMVENNIKNRKEFLYKLLRDAGANIPPYSEMDGRLY